MKTDDALRLDAPLRVLVLEDVPTDAELAMRELKRSGLSYTVHRVETEASYRRALHEFDPDIILSDFALPGFDGLSALKIAQHERPHTPFVFVSGTMGEDSAVDALKLGATDYILKGNLARLGPATRRALKEANERRAHALAEQALRHSEERFRQLAQYAPVGIFIIDPAGRLAWANPRMHEIAGLKVEDNGRRDWLDVLHPDERAHAAHAWTAAVQTQREFSIECRLQRPNGSVVWAYVGVVPLSNTSESGIGHIGTVMDMTEHKLQQEKIARLSRIRAVSSAINGAIVRIHDRAVLFNEACRIAVEQGGFRLAVIGMFNSVNGKLLRAVHQGGDDEFVSRHLQRGGEVFADSDSLGAPLREHRPAVCNDLRRTPEVWRDHAAALACGYRAVAVLPLQTVDAAVEALLLFSCEPDVFDQEELGLLEEIASDISFALSYIEKEERLNYLAYYDTLTGLPNRARFEEHLAQQLETSVNTKQPMAVLSVAIEGVREIHEALGHTHGDALLRQIGPRLRALFIETELVAYQGEHQFTVLLPRSDVGHAVSVVQQIQTTLVQPFPVGELPVNVRAHIGVALYPQHANDSHALIRRAALAAQFAKNAEQEYAFYVPGLDRGSSRHLVLAAALRHAIDNNELALFCQPKIDLRRRVVCGVEALVRWDGGSRGLIAPGEFIPLAERVGLIRPITHWMLEASVRQAHDWQAAGLACPIAVNLSSHNLHERDLVARIEQLLSRYRMPAGLLQLEVTESAIMKDPERVLVTLTQLRAMGIELFIDDFGTGYSSLGYLKRLPVHAVKIDKSFVLDMATNHDSNVIVESTVTLGHHLGLKVIAEGVETLIAYDRLTRLGCDEAQGYYMARPMPASQFAAWLNNSRWPLSPTGP
jgi:diguanylate cyclase (GGDEF)-like protein/PAS domain S-box-containing protein